METLTGCHCTQRGVAVRRVNSVPYASRVYWVLVEHEGGSRHWNRMGFDTAGTPIDEKPGGDDG